MAPQISQDMRERMVVWNEDHLKKLLILWVALCNDNHTLSKKTPNTVNGGRTPENAMMAGMVRRSAILKLLASLSINCLEIFRDS